MNKLNDQTSPYLLQHADNPVDWHPWGPEALERAQREDKPILLSIGYSACHWCHVMAHESFEDADTAALMNELYVNIKVDREERPDLDKIYQTAHHLLTRNQGGWPLTMFLSADDHIPFFGGTYFPRAARHGLPGFKDVLASVANAYREHDGDIRAYKAEMAQALAQTIADDTPATSTLDPELAQLACTQLSEAFDETQGGFGAAPKFPHPSGLELLLTMHAGSGSDAATCLHMADRTLQAMARGGINDHLGGGFCRYSVDASWTIPHFEKMLYDNGPLLSLYTQIWAVTQTPFYRSVAEATGDWALAEMQSPRGGFYSSLDADSEGEEGRYYVWALDEVREVAGDDYSAFARRYGLDGPPNFEGRWHMRLAEPDNDESPVDASTAASIERAKRALLKRRETRVRPGLDDKVLTSWNALMIKGLATAGRLLQRDDYVQAASRAVAYLKSVHWREERLLATSKDGNAHLNAYLDDYAYLIDALLALLQARWDDGDLAFALGLTDVLLAQFEDSERGGFFFTANDHEKLIQRSKTFTDDSMASGNAVAALALFKLAHLVGEARYATAAECTLRAAIGSMTRWPSAHAAMMTALNELHDPPPVIVLRGADAAVMQPWTQRAQAQTLVRGSSYAIPADAGPLPGILDERVARDGGAITAYLCRGHVCSAPVTTLDAFEALLAGAAR